MNCLGWTFGYKFNEAKKQDPDLVDFYCLSKVRHVKNYFLERIVKMLKDSWDCKEVNVETVKDADLDLNVLAYDLVESLKTLESLSGFALKEDEEVRIKARQMVRKGRLVLRK